MTRITSHVLDTTRGRPASGMDLELEVLQAGGDWRKVGQCPTDDDGRASGLSPTEVTAGIYRLRFDTGAYFARAGKPCLYPEVVIAFEVEKGERHYHIPLLLGPWGYTTYRGS